MKISRRAFFGCLGLGALGAATYGFAESRHLEVLRHSIVTGKPGRPVKILHMADLHASDWAGTHMIEEAIRIGLKLKPDAVCITGDLISNVYDDFPGYSRLLGRLASDIPVFVSLGNHDGGRWSGNHRGYPTSKPVRDMVEKSGAKVLFNDRADVRINGRSLSFVGLGDPWSREFFPSPSLFSKTESPRIVLSHNPDTKDRLERYPWNILLSGHTHGGQLRLPGLGSPFAPVKDKRFVAGLYSWQNRWIHVTKGVGSGLRLRFNCLPDVSLLTVI